MKKKNLFKSDAGHCEMKFAIDENGKEMLLKDGRFQVMMEWEKPYMEACIDALHPAGDVLEIGFGLGFSATHIQTYQPKSHTIIEFHPEVAKRARDWAKSYRNITIIEDTWQNALSHLEFFDTIFFDDYPLESDEEMQHMKKESSVADHILASGKKRIGWVYKLFPSIDKIKYKDEDIDDFFSMLEKKESISAQFYLKFFSKLEKKEQISKEQFYKILQRLKKEQLISEIDLKEKPVDMSPFSFRAPSDRLFVFLEECLKNHMREGARFSCFLNYDTSLYEHPIFLEKIADNPYLDVFHKTISINVPSNCDYFRGDKAQILTIQLSKSL